jgi:hypothetical protein
MHTVEAKENKGVRIDSARLLSDIKIKDESAQCGWNVKVLND